MMSPLQNDVVIIIRMMQLVFMTCQGLWAMTLRKASRSSFQVKTTIHLLPTLGHAWSDSLQIPQNSSERKNL